MSRYLVLLFFLLLLPACLPVWGQSMDADKPAWIVGGAWQQGQVMVHTAKIRHLSGMQPSGWELNLQRQSSGTQAWQQLYGYPRLGASFIYLDFQHPAFGRSFALSPYLSLPVRRRKNSLLHVRLGTGLAFLSNRFDRQTNPANNIISARFNAVIQNRLEYERRIGQRLHLLAGLGLNHYSNGGNVKPNLGVNIFTASLGLNFYTNPDFKVITRKAELFTRSRFFTASTSLGIKQRNDFDPEKYLVQSVALAFSQHLNPKSTVLLGVEGFYDPSLYARRAWDPRIRPGSQPDIRRIAFNMGHELNLGKLALGAQAGIYFYRPYKADALFYQRLETRYYLFRHVFLAAGLKLHDLIKADVIEYRLGLRI